MKKIFKKLNKKRLAGFLSSATFSFLSLMLVDLANSTSCFFVHQPKEPRAIDDFKWIK